MLARKIIHVDMDAFYASVEQRDRPELRGKPILVGGSPERRGVVATCSYEARRFGIHSAMSMRRALSLCPQAILVAPRFAVYRAISLQLREIFSHYSDLVEPLSLDEAYIDVTQNKQNQSSATMLAKKMKEEIFTQVQLTASAGVSFNKLLAKLASDAQKPNGLTVITPQDAQAFLDPLPIEKLYGVGNVTARRLREIGIQTCAGLKQLPEKQMQELFGERGLQLYRYVRGDDERFVEPERERKSLGREITLAEDCGDTQQMLVYLEELAAQLAVTLREYRLSGKTLTLKLRWSNFQLLTRSITLTEPIQIAEDMMPYIRLLFKRIESEQTSVRLLGISLSNLLVDGEKEMGSRFFAPSLWTEESG